MKNKINQKLPETNWFSRQDHLKWHWIIGTSIFLILIFSIRDLPILLNSDWPHLYAVVEVPILRWEEIIFYLPFATEFTWSNWFPIAPTVDGSINGWSFFPTISILIYQLLYKTIASGSIDFFLILLHTLLPLINFWIVYAIYRLYINKSWSLLLSFLGIFYFSEFSSFSYILEVLNGNNNLISSASISPPEISRIPFPGISLPFFLITFYLTIKNNRLDQRKLFQLSIFWGLQIYIYAFNFIAGILFWLMWIIYAKYISDKGFVLKNILKEWIISLTIIFSVSSPYVIKFLFFQSKTDQQFLESLIWVQNNLEVYSSNWGGIISYLFPTIFVICIIFFFRGDFYELFYKFSPVFIAMIVDLIIGSMHLIFGEMIEPTLYQDRISGIIFRFFFFIPLLYFLGNPLKKIQSGKNIKLTIISKKIHSFLHQILITRRLIICGLGIFLISGIEILGGIRYFHHHEQNITKHMKVTENEIEIIKNANFKKGIVAIENVPSNFLIPLFSKHSSLLVSKYGNYIQKEEILNRLILFAKLFHWDENRFINFMTLSNNLNLINKKNQNIIKKSDIENGLGYWLLNHNREMDTLEAERYKTFIVNEFRKHKLPQLIEKFDIKATLSNTPMDFGSLPNVSTKKIDTYYLNTFSI